jgi:hypothetical protein
MNLLQNIMFKDNLVKSEALEVIRDMIHAVEAGEDPENVLSDYGLESDYISDLLDYCRFVVA